MGKIMLIDASHPEESRVAILNNDRLDEFDFETTTKKQLKGNIYLAKVIRVEKRKTGSYFLIALKMIDKRKKEREAKSYILGRSAKRRMP